MPTKQDFLHTVVEHLDMKKLDVVPIVEAMEKTAFSARDLARAAKIYDRMLRDDECAVILTLAGSLASAGMKKIIHDMVANNMVDAIVSTGAVVVDQDFFEALGFKHYQGSPDADDNLLRELAVDRIYDTYIDEDELRVCDETCSKIFDSLEPRPHSSRELIREMGRWLEENGGPKVEDSFVYAAYKNDLPIFVPAFSDCSAGFGFVTHQTRNPERHVSIDSAKDFLELTRIKTAHKETGVYMIGGGVPKNFTQDIVVAADLLEGDAAMHKYAIQITVADERDGALSGSTLKEASSWGKVDQSYEQMVYAEATLATPLVSGYAYGKGAWKERSAKRLSRMFQTEKAAR